METPISVYLYPKKYCKTIRKYVNDLLFNDTKTGRRAVWRVWTESRAVLPLPVVVNGCGERGEGGEASRVV